MADQKIEAGKASIARKGRPAKAAVAATALGAVEAAKAAPAVAPALIAEAVAAPAAPAAQAAPAPQRNNIQSSVNTTQPGATNVNQTIENNMHKAQETAQQATQQATEQFRGALNEANERGKVAIEKSSRLVEEMADLTRGNLEAFVASQKTAAKFVETLTQGAADYSRRSFEEASSALRSFSEAKSPSDIFRLQSDYARSAFDAMISQSARVSETVVKMTGEVAEPITSRYAVAAERLKTVAA
jgi:phasin family protein